MLSFLRRSAPEVYPSARSSFLPLLPLLFEYVLYMVPLLTYVVDDDLQIGDRSRAPAGVSMDGQASHVLKPGESVTVRASLHPIPCINRSSISDPALDAQGEGAGPGKEDDWVRDINNLLQYNATFRSKALLRHSRT